MPLPPLPTLETIKARLDAIFPAGLARRNYVVRDMAAQTVFVMFYVGAVEDSGTWLRPNQVTRMTDAQASRSSFDARLAWAQDSLRPSRAEIPGRWFADNTREPIRDETLRNGLQRVGAVIERPGLSVTSSIPRWALAKEFAELFLLPEDEFAARVEAWRTTRLSAGALARVTLARRGISAGGGAQDEVRVNLPNGEVRRLPAGPSSDITKAVIECFATRFLCDPGVLWASDSRTHVVARDDELARAVGLEITETRLLPDIVLVDLGWAEPVFVFLEVVASEGPMEETRKTALLDLVVRGGHSPDSARFGTAYWDRGAEVFRRTVGELAWDSFAWFATEPEQILVQRDTARTPAFLTELLP